MDIVDHVMTWFQSSLALYGRLEPFNYIWRSIPAYDLIIKQSKRYSEISLFTGKEYRWFFNYMLNVLQTT